MARNRRRPRRPIERPPGVEGASSQEMALEELRSARKLRNEADSMMDDAAIRSHSLGATWEQIAKAAGMSLNGARGRWLK